jgi:geranylgeranyl pyrophosphate synthase
VQAEAVLDWLDAFVDELPVAPVQAALFKLQIEQGREQARHHPLPAAELPGLVYSALTGKTAPEPLAGACLCVWLGADLLDNVIDKELPEGWAEVGTEAATLTAVTFLVVIWKALGQLREHGVPPKRVAALVELFAHRLLEMSAGEYADLVGPERMTTDHAKRIALAKSGTQFALYASAGAVAAGASTEVRVRYAEYGHCLGMGSQLMSDLADVCRAPDSDDLRSGALTLPVVHALTTLGDRDRQGLADVLDSARNSAEARADARLILIRAGSPEYVAHEAYLLRNRARGALAATKPGKRPGKRLRDLADLAATWSDPDGGSPLQHMTEPGSGASSEEIADELRRQAAS